MFSWKLNPKTLSDAQNTSTLRLASQKAAFSHHWQRADNSRKDPLLSQASHIPAPHHGTHREPASDWRFPPIIAMRPLGREREVAGEGPPTRKILVCSKDQCFFGQRSLFPMASQALK